MFIPVLIVTGDSCGGQEVLGKLAAYDEGKQARLNFVGCLVGTVIASMVGLPLVLLHAGTLSGAACGYWIGSSACMAISAAARGACARRVVAAAHPPPPRSPRRRRLLLHAPKVRVLTPAACARARGARKARPSFRPNLCERRRRPPAPSES